MHVLKWWNGVINIMQFYAENTDDEWEATDSACDEQAQDITEFEFKEEWLATYPDMQAQPLQEQDFPSPVYIRQVYKRKRPARANWRIILYIYTLHRWQSQTPSLCDLYTQCMTLYNLFALTHDHDLIYHSIYNSLYSQTI